MNHINICPSCIHRNSCVLTMQKDKVWSCSEYDEEDGELTTLETVRESEKNEERKLELV
ncbi:hypothetical protein [Winogradskyella sp.]|uniref:hypothetical protein n=1 Tax=Winogradskyella sp. TaxID=1883156 RepID=UPI0035113AF2